MLKATPLSFKAVERSCPEAFALWEAWIEYHARAGVWHGMMRDGLFSYRLAPMEWLVGPLLVFFAEQGIYIDLTLTFDCDTAPGVYYRDNKGSAARVSKKRLLEPRKEPVDAILAAMEKCFMAVEAKLLRDGGMMSADPIDLRYARIVDRALSSPHGTLPEG